ncbi:P-loop containing nucleoside triphosphate hydrolase protein [Abortiporus biennis]|nr:P-loop containing nucleoside triphosphate hydrolase protein [Abortiporus biennis]
MSRRDLSTVALPPALRTALLRAGYETIEDVNSCTQEALAKELTQTILSATQRPKAAPSSTQSAAALVQDSSVKYSSSCRPLDKLLNGGLKRGCVLEISGPPGTAKESIAINFAASFTKNHQRVVFVDMQNMTNPDKLRHALKEKSPLPANTQQEIKYVKIHTLPELMMFLTQLPSYSKTNPSTALLVLNSISFPFQSLTGLPNASRNAIFAQVKDALTKACATSGLTVIITTQMSTKLLTADGSPANFDTGSRAIMVPQPGPAYLPNGRTYRIILVPHTRTSGVMRLLSSPAHVQGNDRQSLGEEPYDMIAGVIQ